MILNIFQSGIFKEDYRRQLLVTLSAILIVLCHGISLGWLSPMLPKLQSVEETPVNFVVDVYEASWLGSAISLGGLLGNFFFAAVMNRFGRKVALYGLAIPHTCIWILFYFAESIEWLYVARVFGGLTGGGMYVVIPLFIGEISDSSIRGRLCSLFVLANSIGILVGFIISSYVPYHIIPCVVVGLPLLYLVLCTLYPETPQQLLRWGREEAAQRSLKFYCNADGKSPSQESQRNFQKQYDEMRRAIEDSSKSSNNEGLTLADFCNKRALKAIMTGVMLMIGNIFMGTFAFINYMSNIFESVHTQLEPNTNTIIIGAVQIVGILASLHMVDRYGRKVLIIFSCVGCGLGTTAFGVYAFYAEETDVDLTAFSAWLPLILMAFTIFVANAGIISVTMVVLVEVLPPKIRSVGTSACLGWLSLFAFISLKTFPLMMEFLGLAATMWFCAAVSALLLFYVVVFLEETKGKSLYE